MEKTKTFFKQGDKDIVVGIVKDAQTVTKEGVKRAMIKLVTPDDKEVRVLFADKADAEKISEKPATRIEKLKIKSGTLIMVAGYEKEKNGKKLFTGVDFTVYSGFKEGFKTEKGNPVTFLLGTACNGKFGRSKNGEHDMFKMSVPVNKYVRGEQKCDWYQVTFFDEIAKRAKAQFEGKKRQCVIRCGELKDYESQSGTIYHNLVGLDFYPAPIKQ